MSVSRSAENVVRDEFRRLLREDYPENFEDVPLAELGIDSLDFFETTMILEDKYGIVVPVAKLHNAITLREICAMLE